jgi:hypothetical protein
LCKEVERDRICLTKGKSLLAEYGNPSQREPDRNDRIANAQVLSEKARISQKAFDWLFGYDYFIAHRSVDGKDYASALYDALTAKSDELDCFLDVKHYGAGGGLTSMQARAPENSNNKKP